MAKSTLSLEQALARAKSHGVKGEVEKARQLYSKILTKFPRNKKAKKGLKGLQNKTGPKIPPELVPLIDHLLVLYSRGMFNDALSEARRLSQGSPKCSIST